MNQVFQSTRMHGLTNRGGYTSFLANYQTCPILLEVQPQEILTRTRWFHQQKYVHAKTEEKENEREGKVVAFSLLLVN